MSKFQLRNAQRSDFPAILDLVKQLALYEKEPESVTSSITDYYQAFDNNLIGAHVAISKDQIVGCTIFYETFSTWRGKMLYLEDFFVLSDFRRMGIGEQLFDAFIKEAKERDCKMVKWQVLDWNTPALDFYNKIGATIEKNWWNGKIIF